MRIKIFVTVLVLISFLSGAFFVPNSFADSKERDEIKKAIGQKKARWSARDTKISQQPGDKRKKRLGSYVPGPVSQEKILITTAASVPARLDWRNYNGNNYVTPVKEQGECSDCWAFATTAALESSKLISNNTPSVFIDLSEQTLSSCSGAGNCSGGYIDEAANFLRDIGLPLEYCFPYTATDGICSVGCSDWLINAYKISNWHKVDPTVEAIKYALYNYGPLVALMSVNTDFYYYSSGVYEYSWGSVEGYHAILIVGYDDAEQCFIIKSSWGEDWGEAGYGKIAYSEIFGNSQFGFWTIAYENAIPAGFPILESIPRDPNNPNTTGQNGNSNTQLSILNGTVKDESGNAVSGAEIKIGKDKVISNAAGIYTFSSLPAGSYIATVHKSGYSTLSENLTIAPGMPVTKDFVISANESNKEDETDKKKLKAGGIKGAGWWSVAPRSVTVNHADAEAYFAERKSQLAAKTSSTMSVAAPMAGDVLDTAEIEQLARGLRYDPKLIYDYVHNRIDYVPYFGALKSPTLTYLDESGNDFDQAALMVALLRASIGKNADITISDVQFVYGKMTLTVAELANWFGVDPIGKSIRGVVDQGRLLCDPFSDSAGPSDPIYMRRVWVSAKINSIIPYVFDPAFKEYTYTSKIDIGTAMSYSRADLIAALETGANIDPNGASVQKLSDANLRIKLQEYTSNLVNTIKSQYPNKSTQEIIGGRSINQTYMGNYPPLFPHTPSSTETWPSIPSGYTTYMTIRTCPSLNSMNRCDDTPLDGYANKTKSTTELTGQTIWIDFFEIEAGANGTSAATLHIGTESVTAGTQQNDNTTHCHLYLDVEINHPYVNDNTADQRSAQLIRNCAHNDLFDNAAYYAYAIPYNFGGMSEKLIKKQKEELEEKLAEAPTSLAATTAAAAASLNLIGHEYLMESEISSRIVAALTDTVYMPQHRILIAAKSSLSIGWPYTRIYYIDPIFWLSSVFSRNQDHAVGELTDGEKKFYKTNYSIASALEQGIWAQLQNDTNSVSTTKLLGMAGTSTDTAQKVLIATPSTWSTIQTQTNYSDAERASIAAFINPTDTNHSCYGGCTIILPAKKINDTWISFIAKRYYTDNANKGHINLNFIVNKENGGFGALNSTLDPATVAQNIPDEYTPPSKGSVNMVDGSYNYKHTSLQLGGGKTGLSFTHTYDSGNKNTIGTMGRGGSHNYDIRLRTMSDPMLMLGERQPVDAAALIAGAYASINLIQDNGTTDNVESWVGTALISNWLSDQILNNTVIVQKGNDTMEYVEYVKKTVPVFAPPPGNTTTLTKNADETYTITEQFGTQYKFNYNKKIAEIADIDNNKVTFAYSGDNLTTVSNNFGRSLSFGYDGTKVSSVYNTAAGLSVAYLYTSDNLDTYTDPEGKEWKYGYDANKRMASLKTPPVPDYSSGITMAAIEYDNFGRVTKETVPVTIQGTDSTADYKFYYSDYRNAVEDPQGHSVAHYYDKKMREIVSEDPFGKQTKIEYDGQNHVVKVTDPLNHETKYEYKNNNIQYEYENHNINKVTNALDYFVTNVYDNKNRLTDTTDNDNPAHNSHFTYDDAKHHLLSARDPLGNTVSATYKANGLKETTTDANVAMTTIGYDPTYGNIQTTTTGSHPAITYYYDSNNKYDIRGLRSGLKDQENATTSFAYNKLGQLTGKTDPLNKISSSVYDNAGRLISKTDRKGDTISYAYAQNGKLETITYPAGTPVTFKYNNLNQLTSMTDSLGTTTYNSYDAAGRLLSMTDPHGFTISYAYDDLGNVKELIYPGNKKVIYTYDELNRLKAVKIDESWININNTATYDVYDPAGRLPGFTNFNGTRTTYGYDNAGRLTAINNLKAAGGDVIATYQFTALDGNGNRKQIEQNEPYVPALGEGNVTYGYNDEKNRLMTVDEGSDSTIDYNFGYDDEGQLQTGYGTGYTFDYEHRLKTIGSTQFNYDGSEKRLEAIRGGVTTKYIYDAGGTLLAEADSNNNITKYYIYGNGLLATVTPTGQTYCYHFNGVGSTIAITDQYQNVVNKYAYDPFGNIAPNPQETISQPFKYVGQFGVMTEPNGFYYMRARYYDPNVGRFISEDPIGFKGGDVNLMAYVGNNPANGIDPSGLIDITNTATMTYYDGSSMITISDSITIQDECTFQAYFSGVGPNQATGIGALGFRPPNDSVAISPAAFGLPYGDYNTNVATQALLRANISTIRISAPGLSDYLTGSTTFTIGDVGDRNIRNSSIPRFDIYRFATGEDAMAFGKRLVTVTITGLPSSMSCPK